jgi:hypothetical protein
LSVPGYASAMAWSHVEPLGIFVSRGRIKPLPYKVPEPRGAFRKVPEPVHPGFARTATVAAQLSFAVHTGPEDSGVAPGRVNLKKSHSIPVSRTITAIAPSGGPSGIAVSGIGARTLRALQIGELIWTVTSGVELEAIHTAGTETFVGARQPALTHQRLLKALISVLFVDAIGTLRGIGVFQALVGRYHLRRTQNARGFLEPVLQRISIWCFWGEVRCCPSVTGFGFPPACQGRARAMHAAQAALTTPRTILDLWPNLTAIVPEIRHVDPLGRRFAQLVL